MLRPVYFLLIITSIFLCFSILAHLLFLELFTFEKRHRKTDITQGSLLTLARIGKFSRLLRPVGPALMFSVRRTE